MWPTLFRGNDFSDVWPLPPLVANAITAAMTAARETATAIHQREVLRLRSLGRATGPRGQTTW